MSKKIINEMTDVALHIKETIEDKNLDGYEALFAPDSKINIMGRFYTLPEMIFNLKEFFQYIEQPQIDIIQIENSEIKDNNIFITYIIEICWVDQKTWEENIQRGSMSFEFDINKTGKPSKINGFTYALQPKVEESETPLFSDKSGMFKPTPAASAIDGLFNFWY